MPPFAFELRPAEEDALRMVTDAPVRRFTRDEFFRMGEAGIFQPEERVELLDGEIIPMLPIGSSHSGPVNQLTEVFVLAGRGRWVTSIQNSLPISKFSVPQPDLVLLQRRADFYRNSLPTAADVILVVEVSDSSLVLDRQRKLPLYAAAGVPEVWIVNVREKVVEVYREPKGRAYRSQMKVKPGENLAPAAFPDATIETAALLAE